MNNSSFDWTNILSHVLRSLRDQMGEANLQYLVKSILGSNGTNKDREYHRIYMRLRRFFESHSEVFSMYKRDGLTWIKVKDWSRVLDLIEGAGEIQSRCEKCETPRETREIADGLCDLDSIPPHRRGAVWVLCRRQMLDEKGLERIWREFKWYLEDVNSKRIVLARTEEAPPELIRYKVLRYFTRFNSRRYLVETLKKYDAIWDIASEKYKDGVFLTLTSDPKRHRNLYEQYRHFGEAFNQFMSYLSWRLGFRPVYVAVYEFTQSGLLHVHVVLFGVSWLMEKDQITKVWERTGQGSINYVYSIVNRGGRWVWASGRPSGTRSDARRYLKKYLEKTLDAVGRVNGFESFAKNQKPELEFGLIALYWAANKRFFSYSYRLYKSPRRVVMGYYRFLFVTYEYLLPDEILDCVVYGVCGFGPPLEQHASRNVLTNVAVYINRLL